MLRIQFSLPLRNVHLAFCKYRTDQPRMVSNSVRECSNSLGKYSSRFMHKGGNPLCGSSNHLDSHE